MSSIHPIGVILFAIGLAALGAFLIAELRAMRKMGDGKSPNAASYAIPWKAVMYAPLAHIPVTALGWYDGLRGLVVVTVFITPMFYVGMLFWGIPAYLLLVRLNIWTICVAGGAIPAILLRHEPRYLTMVIVGACVAVSATAYLLSRREKKRAAARFPDALMD
ncbi:hypothetical protein [Duganella sp.]|uniref:hypothetical protein n=1 Tax=Duganella sp. TaxID=1904440 RepID=UPI0031D7A35C